MTMVTLEPFATLSAVLMFSALMVYAGLSDLKAFKIPNWLIGLLVASYALLAPLAGFGLREIGFSIAVGAIVLVIAFALFSFGWIGGGDAKLGAATALWLGADHTLGYLFYTTLLGGGLAIGLLMFRSALIPVSWHRWAWINRLHAAETGIPYGVAMAAAALIVFKETPWMGSLLTKGG